VIRPSTRLPLFRKRMVFWKPVAICAFGSAIDSRR